MSFIRFSNDLEHILEKIKDCLNLSKTIKLLRTFTSGHYRVIYWYQISPLAINKEELGQNTYNRQGRTAFPERRKIKFSPVNLTGFLSETRFQLESKLIRI